MTRRVTMGPKFVLGAALFLLPSCAGTEVSAPPPLSAHTGDTKPIVIRKPDVIKGYEEFLSQYGDVNPALRSEALKRLGDLYLERAHKQFLAEMEAYEKQPQGSPPVVDYRDAIRVYDQLLRTDPSFHAQDDVLYALARAHSETGRRDLAQPLLARLVTDFPASPHSQEAYFRIGENEFDQRRFDQAADAYEHALSLNEPFFQDKARYKLGWTYFNLQAYPKAIDNFVRLVDQKSEGHEDLTSDTGSLVWEALTYVTISFRTLGGPSRMAAYFKEKGRAYEKDLYLMMANQYVAEGQVPKAIETYRTFVRDHPLHPMAPIFSSYIVEAYEREKDPAAAQETRIQLVTTYSSASTWYRVNDASNRERTRPLIKDHLYRLGISAHTRAREEKNPEEYRQALRWYRQFLLEFPREKETREIHLFLAESLLALQDYAKASEAYEAVAYNYTGPVDKEAAYSAIVAAEKLQGQQGQERFIDLAKRFANQFTNDGRSPSVLLKSGEILFEQQRDADVREVLEQVLSRYPKFAGAATAQKMVAHTYLRQGRYQEARAAYAATLRLLPESEKSHRREVTDLVAAAMYKQAEQQTKDNRPDEAAKTFAAISREAPESALAASALFEAAGLYETLKQPRAAIESYQQLAQHDPTSDLGAKASLRMGLLYEQGEQWRQAAEAFEAAARVIQDRDQASTILWSAGRDYEKVPLWGKSYDAFSQFTEQFPSHPNAPEGLLKMAQARQRQGRTTDAVKLFARAEQRAPGTPVAAQAVLQQAEESFRNLKRITLKEPFKTNFRRKTKALDQTVTLYTRAAESRYLDVVATSAYRLGEVFEHFKSALLEAELPKKLNKEQKEEYRFQLEEKAFPFEEKAVQAYASNLQRASSRPEAYNEWVKKSYHRLAELRPALYKRPERTERITPNIDVDTLIASRNRSSAHEVVAGR